MAIDPINQYSQTLPKSAENTPDIPAKTSGKTPDQAGFQAMGAASKEEGKGVGPDYVLDDSLKPKEIVGGVPFAPTAAAQTLASLPPIHPLGTAALTELSLQKMMQPQRKMK
jgi:hypothetical protein